MDSATRTKLEDEGDQDQPFLATERRHSSLDSDIELSELQDLEGVEDGQQAPSRHYRVRSIDGSPPKKRVAAWKIALTLVACVVGFTVNTEATAYIEDKLNWKKPIATMYLTHSALALPWIAHMLYLRYTNRQISYVQWVREYNNTLRGSIATIDAFATHGSKALAQNDSGGHTHVRLYKIVKNVYLPDLVYTVYFIQPRLLMQEGKG